MSAINLTRCLICLCILSCFVKATEADVLDRPVHFSSVKNLVEYSRSREPFQIHPLFGDLLAWFTFSASPSERAGVSPTETQRLRIINGMTPRQIMLYALQERVRQCELSELSDRINLAERIPLNSGEPFSVSEPLYKHRITEAVAFRALWIQNIRELSTGVKH